MAMYPPIETPTSPDDHNMVILDGLQQISTPEQIPKMAKNPLRMFSDSKEIELKRTSLKLDSSTMKALDDNDLLLRNKRFSLNDRDLIMAMSKRKSNTYSNTTATISHGGTAGADDPTSLPVLLDNRPTIQSTTTSGGGGGIVGGDSPSSEKDENENYCDGEEIDNKNGNDRIMDCGQLANTDDNNISLARNQSICMADGDHHHQNHRNSGTTCDENEEDENEEDSYHRLITEEDADSDGKEGSAKCCVMASNSSSCCLSSGAEECASKENRNSIASSTDESVELREKLDQDELQDEFDEQRELLFGQHQQQRHSRRLLDNNAALIGSVAAEEPMDMLSPNEGPLARRYAEIAQFNGKW